LAETAATIAQKLPFRNPVREHYEKAHGRMIGAQIGVISARVLKQWMPWMVLVFLITGAVLGVEGGVLTLALWFVPLGFVFYLLFWLWERQHAKSLAQREVELEEAEAALNQEVERLQLLEEQAG
jgi:hypothetical protein